MSKYTFSGTLQAKNAKVKTKLDLISFIQDGITIVFAPALDLSGYGKDENEARHSFAVVFEEYIKYTLNKGTFEADLNQLGWKVSKKGKNISLKSPDIFSNIEENESLREIWNTTDFKKYNQQFEIPVPQCQAIA